MNALNQTLQSKAEIVRLDKKEEPSYILPTREAL